MKCNGFKEACEFIDKAWCCVNDSPHVTLCPPGSGLDIRFSNQRKQLHLLSFVSSLERNAEMC